MHPQQRTKKIPIHKGVPFFRAFFDNMRCKLEKRKRKRNQN
ncbi:hypothetical protein LEP1GSC052_2051 [Leptospira kmetyi serovar Malaysia str. Bejo-Iso9]|nr:hypothetical protein LEP1GSC052_2051 [Leptospira kmetyi serovar Malaysia str. Bejo-Iso9]